MTHTEVKEIHVRVTVHSLLPNGISAHYSGHSMVQVLDTIVSMNLTKSSTGADILQCKAVISQHMFSI